MSTHSRPQSSDNLLASQGEQIIAELEADPLFRSAKSVLLFCSLPDEVNTHTLIETYKDKKNIILPTVCGDELELHSYDSQSATTVGAFNITESLGPIVTDYSTIDLAVIPGMAFNKDGHRLGRGKGYYDRLLPHLKCPKIGICYPHQLLNNLPTEPHDMNVDRVVSLPQQPILYLYRHGETEENRNHILQGCMPGTLTEEGMQNIRESISVLNPLLLDSIICSDLKRCMDTAEILNAELDLPIMFTGLLRERDWGSATGAKVDGQHRILIPADAESVDGMKERARKFLELTQQPEWRGKHILVVSHGLFLRCLQAVYYGKELSDIERMHNCEVRLL